MSVSQSSHKTQKFSRITSTKIFKKGWLTNVKRIRESRGSRLAMERSHPQSQDWGNKEGKWWPQRGLEEYHRTGDVVTGGPQAESQHWDRQAVRKEDPNPFLLQLPIVCQYLPLAELKWRSAFKVSLPGHRIGWQQTKNGFGSMNVWGFNTVWKKQNRSAMPSKYCFCTVLHLSS